MNSKATARFWKPYERLPRQVQKRARKAYELWRTAPNSPGLQFKRVRAEESIFSVRIGLDYRVLGILEGDTMIWYWIGSHDEYERLLG